MIDEIFSKIYVLKCEKGLAMPTALMLVLMIGAAGAIFSRTSLEGIKITKLSEAAIDTFQISEGVTHDVLRQMSVTPHLWREKTNLATQPSDYTMYVPSNFAATNGIPTCSGIACQRDMFPVGGGLIKNFGPIGGSGDIVDGESPVTGQFDTDAPPTADVTLNGRDAWVQVERLDETSPGAGTVGGELANNPGGGNSSNSVRYRITGTTLRPVKGRNGRSTIVMVAELPAS